MTSHPNHLQDSGAGETTIVSWLESELDKKIASMPDDGSRVQLLKTQMHVWENFFHSFAECGHQPFGAPHPVYGEMDAFDFRLLLCAITERKTRLERIAA